MTRKKDPGIPENLPVTVILQKRCLISCTNVATKKYIATFQNGLICKKDRLICSKRTNSTGSNVPRPAPQEDQYMPSNLQLIILRPAAPVRSFCIMGK